MQVYIKKICTVIARMQQIQWNGVCMGVVRISRLPNYKYSTIYASCVLSMHSPCIFSSNCANLIPHILKLRLLQFILINLYKTPFKLVNNFVLLNLCCNKLKYCLKHSTSWFAACFHLHVFLVSFGVTVLVSEVPL